MAKGKDRTPWAYNRGLDSRSGFAADSDAARGFSRALDTRVERSVVTAVADSCLVYATGKRGWNSASKKGAQAHHMCDAARHACETDRGVSQHSTHEEHRARVQTRDRDWTGERGQSQRPIAHQSELDAPSSEDLEDLAAAAVLPGCCPH
jgi:hypothetical protein